ncbi:MAG: amino acid racemase [candidate division WOR-3 bacterium]|jgi:aspartate racemase
MKRIGIVGGLGPEATVDYYRVMIEDCRKRTGGRVPEIIIYSVDVKDFPMIDQRDKIVEWLGGAINALHRAGADFAALTANTPHIVFDELVRSSPVPLISIVEETRRVVQDLGMKKVGLLGTRVTMNSDFYERVFSKYDISIVVPTEQEQDYINDKLFTEIMFNRIIEETRQGLLAIIKSMIEKHRIEAVILGCTELPLILTGDAFGISLLNTTKIHAESLVRYCMEK